jgi:hypothetical protein
MPLAYYSPNLITDLLEPYTMEKAMCVLLRCRTPFAGRRTRNKSAGRQANLAAVLDGKSDSDYLVTD